MRKELVWADKQVKVSELKGYKDNPREITPENKKRLQKSLKKFNQVKPLLVDVDMTVIGGNQRLSVIENELVWVRMPNRALTEEERQKIAIIHNNKIGDWDFGKMAELGIPDEVLVDTFGFDQELVNELGFDFDNLDFDDMEDDKVIKKLIVSFPKNVNVNEMVAQVNQKLGTATFEESLLVLVQRYEDNHY